MNVNGYETFTTFWQDFSIADRFGVAAIKDTFTRAFNEWKHDYKYLTELVMVLNWKIWQTSITNCGAKLIYTQWKTSKMMKPRTSLEQPTKKGKQNARQFDRNFTYAVFHGHPYGYHVRKGILRRNCTCHKRHTNHTKWRNPHLQS